MKAGDLIRYIPEGDNVTGVIVSVTLRGKYPRAKVVWSLGKGPHYDEVLLEDLEVISESR